MIRKLTKSAVIGLLLAAVCLPVSADDYGSAMVERITSIYDGDTFRADIAGWHPLAGERVPIRINGIDAPELRARCDNEKRQARAAKQWLAERLRSADVIELRHMERGKYFRIVADVYADGADVGREMMEQGLAVPYDGGHKANPWCD